MKERFTKSLAVEAFAKDGNPERLRFTASTSVEDRDGDVVKTGDAELAHFRSNPVFL